MYDAVLDWLYDQTLKPFYIPGDVLPNMWDAVKHIFDNPKLEHINMTEHAFCGIAVIFHRCIQMTTSDDPEEYPTLYH